ncbi:phage tail protein X [Paraburkholderia unamae]|uniref:tail protein X n=1 Tax=Paraburkholderia unamae TaxID=219649 RepID=UPI000DC536FA|nr:tail protein X [Paraburkholderia unamae]RAR53887.1 phage tail protein X [Paraburkholderia unamae]
MKVTARQGDSVDAMCWRHYGRTSGTVEAVLEANPGIGDYGVILPLGTAVEMPEIDTIVNTTPLVQLFD